MSKERWMPRASRWLPCIVAGVLALPLWAQDETRTMRTTLPDGSVATGDLQRTPDGIQGSNVTIVWEDGRTFTGAIFDGHPIRGTLRYPDGSGITGVIDDLDDTGARRWLPGASRVHTVSESTLGPPGTYRLSYWYRGNEAAAWVFGAPFQPDRSSGDPFDAETLARPTRNTQGCPAPTVVPAGWIVWWPRCRAGSEAAIVTYSPDGTQKLVEYISAAPERTHRVLTRLDGKGYGADLLVEYGATSLQAVVGSRFFDYKANFYANTARPTKITAKTFTDAAAPSPVGEGKLFDSNGNLLFNGTFDGQRPVVGRCRIPVNEGGGSEPCEFRNEQRIDPAHAQRQQRVAALKQEADTGPQQARAASNQWKQEQDRRVEQEYEQIRQRNRANDAVNEVNWGQVMNDVGDTFRRSAEELNDFQRENARRLEQARRADEAYRSQQQRAAQEQAQREAAQRQQQEQLRAQQANANSRASTPPLTVNTAVEGAAPATASAPRTSETYGAFESAACADLRGEMMPRPCFADAECPAREHQRMESIRERMVAMGCPGTGSGKPGGVRGDP